MRAAITINRQAIAAFCARHHIRRLALFGSVLRDDFRPDSDVDVLVEFDPAHIPGLITLMRMQEDFSNLIGRQADFRETGARAGAHETQVAGDLRERYGEGIEGA